MEDKHQASSSSKGPNFFSAPVPTPFNSILYQQDLQIIIEKAERDAAFRSLCHDLQLTEFWNLVLSKKDQAQRLTSILHYGIPSFKPQLGIHPFDLICGVYYSDRGLQALDSRSFVDAEQWFLKGEACRFFHSVLQLNQMDIEAIYDITSKAKQSQANILNKHVDLNAILTRGENMILFCGTPAYILLAMTMFYVAKYNKHVLKEAETTSAAYQLLIQYLETARLLQPYCQIEIHNAYFGRGIPGSNPYGCTTIDALIEKATWYAGDCLDSMSISLAKNKAKHEAQTFLEKRGIVPCDVVDSMVVPIDIRTTYAHK